MVRGRRGVQKIYSGGNAFTRRLLVTGIVVVVIDAGQDVWGDVVAAHLALRPPRKRKNAERDNDETEADGGIQHGRHDSSDGGAGKRAQPMYSCRASTRVGGSFHRRLRRCHTGHRPRRDPPALSALDDCAVLWLSAKEVRILESLGNGCSLPLHMVDQARGELKPGSVYTMLNRKEKKGRVGSTSRSQREYQPTEYGLRMLEAWERRL